VLELRKHGIVLVATFVRALALTTAGAALVVLGWPASIAGAVLMTLAALVALRAVWTWDRTKILITTDKLYLVSGLLRRRSAAVKLSALGRVEIEQTLAGRLLGYGTLTVGDLAVDHLPRPRELHNLIAQLAS
jgi:uncharacterized membrane protein YdbT with pleckstrin-like domain